MPSLGTYRGHARRGVLEPPGSGLLRRRPEGLDLGLGAPGLHRDVRVREDARRAEPAARRSGPARADLRRGADQLRQPAGPGGRHGDADRRRGERSAGRRGGDGGHSGADAGRAELSGHRPPRSTCSTPPTGRTCREVSGVVRYRQRPKQPARGHGRVPVHDLERCGAVGLRLQVAERDVERLGDAARHGRGPAVRMRSRRGELGAVPGLGHDLDLPRSRSWASRT